MEKNLFHLCDSSSLIMYIPGADGWICVLPSEEKGVLKHLVYDHQQHALGGVFMARRHLTWTVAKVVIQKNSKG